MEKFCKVFLSDELDSEINKSSILISGIGTDSVFIE